MGEDTRGGGLSSFVIHVYSFCLAALVRVNNKLMILVLSGKVVKIDPGDTKRTSSLGMVWWVPGITIIIVIIIVNIVNIYKRSREE